MYKNVCHKIIVYVLVGCLSFGVPATTYYKSVHAIEFLGGALAFEEALKWLLAIVGVTVAGSVASQVDWSEVRDQCVEVQLNNGASQAQVSEWWAKLARGTLDKASSCWESFKEWAQSLTPDESTQAPSSGWSSGMLGSDWLSLMRNTYGQGSIPSRLDGYINNSHIYAFCINGNYGYIWTSTNLPTMQNNQLNVNNIGYSWYRTDGFIGSGSDIIYLSNYSSTIISSNIYNGYFGASSPIRVLGDDSASSSYDWQSAIDVAKQNLELLNRDLPDENASEVAIPMPGLADSDDEASADAYDNIVDAINDGTITLDDGIAQIQDLLHVLVIDDTTDIVQPVRPDPDTGEDQTKEDVIKENKSNMGFTLAGLEKVFPFCIPFDIYAFMTLLVAEPVAPEFDFPIKSVNNQTEEIHIDLSPFEPVAVVVRYIFDFLFIIGLALMTRSLIGGGSSD